MGDSQNDTVRVDFDHQIKLEFHGSTVTSDAGLLAYRELDDALTLITTAASELHDTCTGQSTQHSLLAWLRQSISSRLAGYEEVNDAERLCLDPALRAVVGGRATDAQPQLTPNAPPRFGVNSACLPAHSAPPSSPVQPGSPTADSLPWLGVAAS
jgi:hypothetical protein